MLQDKYPMVFWDYCEERQGEILSVTAWDIFQLYWTNPHTMTFGDEYNISNMCKFGSYKWCHYFYDSKVSMSTFQKSCMGHVIGPDKNKGNEMIQWIFKENGNIIQRRMVKKMKSEHLD